MKGIDAVADAIVDHSRLVIVVLLIVSVVVGAGASQVEEQSSLNQFQTDSTEAEKLDYIESNFTADGNTTTVQVIVRRDNVLSKSALLDQLRFEQALLDNRTVNNSLAAQRPGGIANVIATTAIRAETVADLKRRGAKLQAQRKQLNRTAARLTEALNRTRKLQARYDRLNQSRKRGKIDEATYKKRAAKLEKQLGTVRTKATAGLSDAQTAQFAKLMDRTRGLQHRIAQLNASLAAGKIDKQTYRKRVGNVQKQFTNVYAGVQKVLAPDFKRLQKRATELEEDRAALQAKVENGSTPPLDAQIDQLKSMNASEIDATIKRVLGSGSDSQAFALMPIDYEPGSTTANASMVVITQTTNQQLGQGAATARIERTQLAIQEIARQELSGQAMTFGAGIVSDEISRSQQDSLQLVSPFALVFVLIVLTIAYRDLLDIVLGLIGIAIVLMLTFGFMGWADIAFNQIMVAVPVLLIGLSIDYAIHVFMRHREERAGDGMGVRDSMATALSGVGIALILVTATTVIGFLSNLTSPVGPIREFGVVSAVGIVAALLVFGALMPAIKIELDALLEGFGFDRRKRAFGTGGGAFERLLSTGATLARRAPWAVIALTLVVSAAGAWGATGVDTSFQNKDFLAEEPPDWMERLPSSLEPGEYSMRSTLTYVNNNFLRQDSTVEFLVEGDVATAEGLQRMHRIAERAAKKDVTVTLSNGEARITSPLTVMRDVAATNKSFNATFTAADTDGDGIPDRNVAAVYGALFDAAPDRAQRVIYRENGEYRATRITISIKGSAKGSAITNQMNDVEHSVEGSGFTVTATGRPIVNEIVQNDLLKTVVQSLLITLVVSFLFLMVVYRITEGSATLGLVTLLPVVFNVTWILGTMFVLDIPFNVLTGMITSLTIGLGVAYSIHISERYSLELDRHESAWDAMETAVTGTGGALLGSAATTVGGFGVLVFAILPPLQQFGFITGLTIVYAFFASVFILPSLLVVWTRYLGPSEMLGSPDEGDDEPSPEVPTDAGSPQPADATAPSEADGGGTTTRQATPPATDATGPAASDTATADASTGDRTAAGTAASSGGQSEVKSIASRSIAPRYVEPGGEVFVTVTLPVVQGRVVVEEFPAGDATIRSVSPEPVESLAVGDRVSVIWDADERTSATVEYAVQVDETSPGTTLSFDGDVLLPKHAISIAGDDSAPVVRNVVDRMLSDGSVTHRDLTEAGRYFEAGDISARQFERVYHAWLDEHAGGDTDV